MLPISRGKFALCGEVVLAVMLAALFLSAAVFASSYTALPAPGAHSIGNAAPSAPVTVVRGESGVDLAAELPRSVSGLANPDPVLATSAQISSPLPNRVYLPIVFKGQVDSAGATMTPDGGSFQLKNGVTLAVPPGAVSAPVSVQLTQVQTGTTYADPYLTALRLDVSGDLGNASLVVPVAPGTRPDRPVAVFFSPSITQPVVLSGTVDTVNNTFTVSLGGIAGSAGASASGAVRALAAGVPSGQINIEGDAGMRVTGMSALMSAPYYEQDGGNCWAATWLAYLKTYGRTQTDRDAIYQLLALMGIGKDAGLNCVSRMADVNLVMQTMGVGGELNQWWSYANFVDYVMQSVDAGMPVYVCLRTHAGLFLGYQITVDDKGNPTIYLIYHDSETVKESGGPQGGPYRTVTTGQLKSEFWSTGGFITVRGGSLGVGPEMQTIHLPDGADGVGGLSNFKGLGFTRSADWGAQSIVGSGRWDSTVPESGYRLNPDPVPSDITRIVLSRVPIWNADRNKDATVTVTTSLDALVQDNWQTLVATSTVQSVPSKGKSLYAATFDADDMRAALYNSYRQADVQKLRVVTDMSSDTGAHGGFDVEFNHRALYVHDVYPPAAGEGDQITINGLGFGVGKAYVFINNTPAEIVNWTRSSITAKVGKGSSSGNLVVEVGSDKSKGVPFTVVPHVLGFTPSYGPVGTQVVITGTGFGLITGTVSFSGTAATIDGWTNAEIRARVPDALDGNGSRLISLAIGDGKNATWTDQFDLRESIPHLAKRSPSISVDMEATSTYNFVHCSWNYLIQKDCPTSTDQRTGAGEWSASLTATPGRWSGNSFSSSQVDASGRQLDVALTLNVDATNPISITLSGTFHWSRTDPGVLEKRAHLTNLPVGRGSSRTAEFEVTGPAAGNYAVRDEHHYKDCSGYDLAPVVVSCKNPPAAYSESYEGTLMSTDWSNPLYQSVKVVFSGAD